MGNVAAILLAAGRSRRMGAFKPLLPFGDKTVIRTCVDNLHDANIDEVIVVIGHRADEIQEQLRDANVTFALNPDPDSEMAASINCGVKTLPQTAGAMLIALNDHPAVPSTVIGSLIREWRSGARLVVPEYDHRGGHPILIDSSFRDQLLQLEPPATLRDFLRVHESDVSRVIVDSPYIARDMDTWDDYLTLHEEIFGRTPAFPPVVDLSSEPNT